jgi:hypothetical protein
MAVASSSTPGVVRLPLGGTPHALDQGHVPRIVQSALDPREIVVEALRHQGPDQHQAIPSHRHVVRGEAEIGGPVQERESAVGQQGPVAGGEPVQRVAPRDQIVDPVGEAPFDVDERGGEPVGIGVEYGPDLGQRHAGGGQCPDLDQPQQVGRSVAPVAGGIAAGFLDQPMPVVVPHGLHCDAGEGRRLADRDAACHLLSRPRGRR